ncbi:helix-turn-helix transcriptional regulator [Tsukamurella sp. PLM1]|uniref:helix-turn-helix transcriptional regulator n=1 Tax=Tsukamurella sp. PLM1 TaxID=2929795 RepID=UPI0035304122
MRKVTAALPEAHRREAAAAAQRIHVREDGFARPAAPEPFLGELQHAVIEGVRLRAVYAARGKAPAERILDPVGLVHAGQSWYLMALRDGERRTYRTSRFQSVALLPEAAQRPDEVDLAAEFEQSRASFRSGNPAVTVTVRADEYGWERLGTFGTPLAEPGPDGAGTLAFRDFGQAVWTLWAALPNITVLGPPEVVAVLRDKLATAQNALGAVDPTSG